MVLDGKTYRKLAIALLVIILVIIGLVLVEKDRQAEELGGTSNSYTVETVNLTMNSIHTLNPIVSSDTDTYYISRLIYDSLFVMDETMTPVKSLVKSYKYSDDRKTLTLELRKDARFGDGSTLKASDVKFTIDAIKAAGSRSIYDRNVKGIVSVSTKGSDCVVIKYDDASHSGFARLTFPIVNSEQFDSIEDATKRKASFIPQGSGQYKVSTYRKGKSLKLVANDNYYGTKPVSKLYFFVPDSSAKALTLLGSNEVSMVVRTEISRDMTLGNIDLDNYDFPSNRLEYIGFNYKDDLTETSFVRQAMCYAIDMENILQESYYGNGVSTDSLYYPGYLDVKNQGDAYALNLRKAKDLLEKQDYTDTDKDGFVEDGDGKDVSGIILVNKENKARMRAARMIKENLAAAGLEMEITAVDFDSYKKRLKEGKYTIYLGGAQMADYFDVSYLIGGSGDFTGCDDGSLIKDVKTMNSGLTGDERRELYTSIKEEMKDRTPYYPICYITYAVVVSNELTGDISPLFNDIYRGCGKWTSTYSIKEPYTLNTEKEK